MKTEVFHGEAREVEAASGVDLTVARIERGELVEAKQYQVERGVWAAEDEKTFGNNRRAPCVSHTENC